MRCPEEPGATVALRYADKTVWVRDLLVDRDPNLLDLCAGHADALTPPRGWRVVDERAPVLSVALPQAERYPA
jgi:hypothetical protein